LGLVAGEEDICAPTKVSSPHARRLGDALQKPSTRLKKHGPYPMNTNE